MVAALQQLVRGQHAGQIQTGDGGTGGNRAGSGQNVLAGVFLDAFFGGNRNTAGAQNGAGAANQIHLGALEHTLDTGGQLLGHSTLVGEDGVHVNVHRVSGDTGVLAGADIMVNLGGMQQGLGGHAATVQAGAAGLAVLHNGHLQAQLSGAQSRNIAAGTGADDDQLIIHRSNLLFCQHPGEVFPHVRLDFGGKQAFLQGGKGEVLALQSLLDLG